MSSRSLILSAFRAGLQPGSVNILGAGAASPYRLRWLLQEFSAAGGGVLPASAKAGLPVSSALEPVPSNGLVLGRYRPLRPLGSGGAGPGWLCRDEPAGRDGGVQDLAR